MRCRGRCGARCSKATKPGDIALLLHNGAGGVRFIAGGSPALRSVALRESEIRT
jgi:hypothetical protein